MSKNKQLNKTVSSNREGCDDRTTPPTGVGTPPAEGNYSPSVKGWQSQTDGVVLEPKQSNVVSKNIPELRFPEFRDAGEWVERKLGDCLNYIQPSKYIVKSTEYNDSYKTPVLTAGKSFILGYTNEIEGVFLKDLPVIIFDDFTTASKFVDFPFKVKSSAIKILLSKKDINIKFVYEAMQNIKYEVGVHERHWISIFSKLNIRIPKPNEQQKIADCLSSVDDLIEAQSQKVELLKEHKKGLMQKLFPSNGGVSQSDGVVSKNIPELRFPEFGDAGEWEERTVKNICNKPFSGGTPLTTNRTFYNGNIPFIRSAEIGKYKTELFLSKDGLENSSAKLVKKGDVLIALYGANSGDVAVCRLDGAINQAVLCLQSKESNQFLYQYLLFKKQNIIAKYLQGGQGNLSAEIIKAIEFYMPNPEEQQKIADCLSSVDELIEAQSQKVELLKEHKKGLMQRLFPVTTST